MGFQGEVTTTLLSYSLGDAIDWKLKSPLFVPKDQLHFSYSLGDAIDWKLILAVSVLKTCFVLLLARGRDRLETQLALAYLTL